MRQRLLLPFILLPLIGCASIALRHPIDGDNRLTMAFCVESTSAMNQIGETFSGEENREKFDSNVKQALGEIETCVGKTVL